MWEERYAGDEYLFGTAPAVFVADQAHRLSAGTKLLAVADGEGRNSVWLAQQGHRVTAFDFAENALVKARRLAEARGVAVAFQRAGILDWPWTPEAFDAVVAVFIQFSPPEERAEVFAGIARTLRPGGMLLLHGYAPRQVEYGTGGPPFVANMYTLDLLHGAFPGWEILHEADYDAEVQEGRGHSGQSALIDFVAVKPSK